MSGYRPTVFDITHAVMDLDENACDAAGLVDRVSRIADNVAEKLNARGVATTSFSKRDARVLLASHGASQFTIEQHALRIARLVRGSASIKHGSWSAR